MLRSSPYEYSLTAHSLVTEVSNHVADRFQPVATGALTRAGATILCLAPTCWRQASGTSRCLGSFSFQTIHPSDPNTDPPQPPNPPYLTQWILRISKKITNEVRPGDIQQRCGKNHSGTVEKTTVRRSAFSPSLRRRTLHGFLRFPLPNVLGNPGTRSSVKPENFV